MPLRGFLQCPRCGRNLTGSASRGKMGTKFFYYHCDRKCKERQRAKQLNDCFAELLVDFRAKPKAMSLYAKILKDKLKQNNTSGKAALEKLYKEIARQRQRLKNAKDLMLDGEFSAGEYKEMKIEIDEAIDLLTREEIKMKEGLENHDTKIDSCLELLSTIDTYYVERNTITKQRIVGSIFPEKLVFENQKYRTPKMNEAAELICRKDKPLRGDKKGKQSISELLSLEVHLKRVELLTS